MTLAIRDALPGDEAAWRGLWAGYLDHYGLTLAPDVTAHTWGRMMEPGGRLKARLACLDGRVAGFAMYLRHESSWVIGEDCYLEDMFVAPDARGQGIARALIEDLAALARTKGWRRLYWHADQDNAPARRLYDSFVQADGHIRYRMVL